MNLNNKITEPEVYSDRVLLSDLPLKIAEEFRLRGLIINGKEEKLSFVGMIMLDDKTYVFLPRSTEQVIRNKKLLLASNTLKAVAKYGQESKTDVDIMDEGDGRKNLNQLSLICTLLDDFRQHGIYTKRREVKKYNSGKTDWKRTINKVVPFPDRKNQPVYLDTYGIQRQYFNNCEIALIHASIIHYLDNHFSWIVSGNLKPIAPELRDYSSPKGNIEYQISKLKNELSQTYSDRDIRLLKLLISYLQSESGTNTSDFIAGLGKFHTCWEHMLGKVLKHTVNLNDKLPVPAYIDKKGIVHAANKKGMRTDIILCKEEEKSYTVADAKYYAATEVGNAPGWGDIVKQLFYEKALKEIYVKASIKNVFVFPGVNVHLKEARIKNRIKSTNETTKYVADFKPIQCYYTDPMVVIEHYINSKKMDELTDELLSGLDNIS